MQHFFKKHKILLCVTLCLVFVLCIGSVFSKYYALFHLDSFGVNISAGPKNYTLNVNIPTTTYSKTYTVSGTITEAEPSAVSLMAIPDFSVTVNDVPATVNDDGSWSAEISLDGTEVVVEATDNNEWSASHRVEYSTFTVLKDNVGKIGFTGTETEFDIPATFYDEIDQAWYKVVSIGVTYGYNPTTTLIGPFEDQTSLTSATIPDTVTNIGRNSFYNCSNLTSVSLPNCVETIDVDAFGYCSFSAITLPSELIQLGASAFEWCDNLESVVIPDKVTAIPITCFQGCGSLSTITIGSSVKTIGDYCFYNCSNLSTITIPNSVTSIGTSCFTNCSKLSSVLIGNGITIIPDSAFANLTSLKTVMIGSGVKTIGTQAFASCTSLTNITIPQNVTTIGANAFKSAGLTKVTFMGTSSWKVGSSTITSTRLANTTTAASYLKQGYASYTWTRI